MSPRRKLLAAIGIGVVLAGPPVAALNIWLNGLVERQGREELDLAAPAAHDAVRGTHRPHRGDPRRSCRPRYRFLPRHQCGRAAPDDVRDHSGQGAVDRRARRPDAVHRRRQSAGAAQGRFVRAAVGRAAATCWNWCVLADSRSSGFASAVLGQATGNGVAALIPAALFVPQVSTAGGPLNFHARMLTAGGTIIAESGERRRRRRIATMCIVAELSSSRYALQSIISASPPAWRPTRAICAHSERSPADFWRSSSSCFRCCCRSASATIRSTRSNGR